MASAPVKEAARPPHPNWWLAPPDALPVNAGLNRTNWDLRLDPVPTATHTFEINANPGLTPTSPEGIIAPPGRYTARLTVGGTSYSQPFAVTADPRSPASLADIRAQYHLLREISDDARSAWTGARQVDSLRAGLIGRMPQDASSEVGRAITAFQRTLDGEPKPGAKRMPTFQQLNATLAAQITPQDNGDQRPTDAMAAAYQSACRDVARAQKSWAAINGADLVALNATLVRNGLTPLNVAREMNDVRVKLVCGSFPFPGRRASKGR